MIKIRSVISIKFACLFLVAACKEVVEKPINQPGGSQKPINQPGGSPNGNAASSNGNSTKDTGTASHLLSLPAGYELIATCLKIIKEVERDPDAPAMSSSMAAATAIKDRVMSSGRASVCNESFAPPGITDRERVNIIEAAVFNCGSDTGASGKLSIKSPEPCAPPVTGSQSIENDSVGNFTIKTRRTINFANLSKQEKDVLKTAFAESPIIEGEQVSVTPDLK